MAYFAAIPEINNYFEELDWEHDSLAPIFFDTLRSDNNREFYQQLGLLELLTIAVLNYNAFHLAYYFVDSFKNFCRNVWDKGILDLSEIKIKHTVEYHRIINVFRPHVKSIILPKHLPSAILDCLPMIKNFTFHISYNKSIMRPDFHVNWPTNITLLGNVGSYYSLKNPATDILFSFRKIKSLKLNQLHLDRPFISALQLQQLQSLSIIKSKVKTKDIVITYQAILNMRFKLREITIILTDRKERGMSGVINLIVRNINKFPNLKKLKISTDLNDESLRDINRSKSLKSIIVYTTNNFSTDLAFNFLKQNNKTVIIKKFFRSQNF